MACLTITNLDTATYESDFGPVLVAQTRNFSVTAAELTAALATLNTDSAAGDINYCTSTDPTGMAQGADASNYMGTVTINSLVAASQTISGDIVVDDITADDIACDAIVATGAIAGLSVAATAAVTGATVAATGAVTGATLAATGAATALSVTATAAVQGATVVATTGTTTGTLAATGISTLSGALRLAPVAVLTAASPYTIAATATAVFFTTDAGAITANLPAATGTGRTLYLKKVDAAVDDVTVSRAGADTIDGATNVVLADQWDYVVLVDSAAAVWSVFGTNV